MDEPRTPNPLLSRLGAALEFALNRAIALDASTREKLARLDGRRIGIELEPLDLAMTVTVDGSHLRVGPREGRERDLMLRATPGSLLAFALRRSDESIFPPGKVDISGDAELARQFEKIMRDFRPDFEEAFARTFGDVAGVPIARMVDSAFAWTRASAKSLGLDAVEFVRDESRDAVATTEGEQFFDDVDALRERTDRLEARIRRLGDLR